MSNQEEEREPNNLYVGNLNYETKKQDIYDKFSVYGKIKIIIFVGKKGFCFVEYFNKENADKAKEALNETSLNGRRMNIENARPKKY